MSVYKAMSDNACASHKIKLKAYVGPALGNALAPQFDKITETGADGGKVIIPREILTRLRSWPEKVREGKAPIDIVSDELVAKGYIKKVSDCSWVNHPLFKSQTTEKGSDWREA